MFLWGARQAYLYLKVVTARVHVVFKCDLTPFYGDGIALLRGHPSHFSAQHGQHCVLNASNIGRLHFDCHNINNIV